MDVAKEIASWAAALPRWQQDIVRPLLTNLTLNDKERAASLDQMFKVFDRKPASFGQPLTQADIPSDPKAGTAPRLVGLRRLRGVNAVHDSGSLEFQTDGLTIVYGRNGAGKSGYVRALKKLCRHVDRQTQVLPNVFTTATPRQQAVVELLEDGKSTAQTWDLNAADASPLASASVFDARCAHYYVVDENTIAFVPTALGLFDRLVHEQTELRRLVDEKMRAIKQVKPDLSEFAADTKAGSLTATLKASTAVRDVEALANLSADETKRAAQLRVATSIQDTERAGRIARLETESREAQRLQDDLEVARDLITDLAIPRLKRFAEAVKTARDARDLAATEAFGGETVSGVGGDPWRQLWEAARSFWQSEDRAGGAFPPTVEGEDCPLCLQDLEAAARGRFTRFENWVRSSAHGKVAEAEQELAQAMRSLTDELIACCRTPFVRGLEEPNPELHLKITGWARAAGTRLTEVRAAVSDPDSPWQLSTLDAPPFEEVKDYLDSTRSQMQALKDMHDPEKLKLLQAESRELAARERLAARLPDVKRWIADLSQLDVWQKVYSALHTAATSSKQRELADAAMTEALRMRLQAELQVLGFSHIGVSVESRGRQGSTLLQLKFSNAGASLDSVLSEGEQRALALAFFFAELTTCGHDATAILDDPVTSLDHDRRERIARRVIEEAGDRQMVVFTHDVAFLSYLAKEAELANVPLRFQHVWRADSIVGRTEPDAPWETLSSEKKIRWLRNKLPEIPRPSEITSPDDQRLRVSGWYQNFRQACERVVEEKLLADVVQRWIPDVATKKLDRVVVDIELVREVDALMTKASGLIHDEPVAGGGALPTRDEMAADLGRLNGIVTTVRDRTGN